MSEGEGVGRKDVAGSRSVYDKCSYDIGTEHKRYTVKEGYTYV